MSDAGVGADKGYHVQGINHVVGVGVVAAAAAISVAVVVAGGGGGGCSTGTDN